MIIIEIIIGLVTVMVMPMHIEILIGLRDLLHIIMQDRVLIVMRALQLQEVQQVQAEVLQMLAYPAPAEVLQIHGQMDFLL